MPALTMTSLATDPLVEPHIDIVLLPHDSKDQKAESEMVLRLRSFRLESLQIAPESFASSYERESQFTEDVWRQRLQNLKAKHIIAVLGKAGDVEIDSGLGSKAWVGMIVVHQRSGTEDVEPGKSPWEARDSQISTLPSTSYHLNGFFVHPSVRRMGLGKQLILAALQYAKDAAAMAGLQFAKVTVILGSSNQTALAVYEKCGFAIVKESTYQIGEGPLRTARSMSQVVAVHEKRA